MPMWFKRVDIEEIKKAKQALPHYFSIIKGDEKPNFFYTRKVEVMFQYHQIIKRESTEN